MKLAKQNLKEIGQAITRSSSNLVRPNVTQDVYNVSGAQLNAATGGDNTHKTIYEYLATYPESPGTAFRHNHAFMARTSPMSIMNLMVLE